MIILENKYFLIFFLFLAIFKSNAQTIIEGTVRDSLGNAVPMCNVFIQAMDNSKVLSYAYTNDQGKYEMNFKKSGIFILTASSLSYKKEKISFEINNVQSQTRITKDINLKSETFALDEVVVNAEIPVLVKKDTIVINTQDFTNGTEEVVEDILKKLPGIEVSKDGTIKVQGKNVEKVMVEGDDLFENGYKLLTKNLHAGVIDKVEILEHFSDNALLKSIEDSEKVALNITLKEDKKTNLFGNMSLGYGSEQFYENKINLISFNKRTKFYFFGNLNNNGNTATGDIYQLIYPDIFTSKTYIGDGESSQYFIRINEDRPNLNENRYNFNNAELASINGIYNPSKKLKLKGLFFFTSDENSFIKSSFEEFFIPQNEFTNTESYLLRKKSIAGSGKWDALYNINKNAQIEYVGRYNLGNFKDRALLLFNNDSIMEGMESKSMFTDHRITLTKKINDSKAFQVTGRYIYDDKPQNYSVDNFLYEELFPSIDNIEDVLQNSKNQMNFFGLEGSYFINKSRNNINIKSGFIERTNHLISNLEFKDILNNIVIADDSYNNNFRYKIQDFYIKSKYKYTLNKIALRTGLEAHQFYSKIEGQEINQEDHQFTFIPSIGISWQINNKNKFLASYKYSTNNIPFNQVYEGYILNNYRSFKRGLGYFDQLKGSFLLASYILGNWSDSFLINTSLIYNKDNSYIGTNSIIQPNYTQTTAIVLKDRDFYSVNFTADKYINWLSSNIKINGNLNNNSIQNIVNNSELRRINTKTYGLGGELRSAFTGSFNFHIGSNWISSVVKTEIKNMNTDNSTFLDINVNISDKLSFMLKNELYYFGSLSKNNSFYFSDFNAQYILKKNKVKFKLIFSNIFNQNSFSNYNISDTGSYSSTYRLLPRYVLLKMDYRF